MATESKQDVKPVAATVVAPKSAAGTFVGALMPSLLARVTKHLEDQEGRDKLAKLVQYGARFLMYHALQSDPKSEFGVRMKGLFTMLRDARKLARLFKTLSEYKKLLELLDGAGAAHHKLLDVAARLGFGAYWFWDNVAWLSTNKVLKYDQKNAAWWGAFGWFVGTASGVLGATIKLVESHQKEASLVAALAALPATDAAARDTTTAELTKVRTARFTQVLNLVKNAGDCTTASNSIDLFEKYLLGFKLNDGVIGLCGLTSAAIASFSVWEAGAKK